MKSPMPLGSTSVPADCVSFRTAYPHAFLAGGYMATGDSGFDKAPLGDQPWRFYDYYYADPDAEPETAKSRAQGVARMFFHSLAYAAVQNPIDGVTQLANALASPFATNPIPRLEIFTAPEQTAFGSAEWTARLAGGGIGTIVPFWLGGKAAVRGMRSVAGLRFVGPAIQRSGILQHNSIAQLTFKGAVYEGLFHSVDADRMDNFWTQRLINSGAGAVSFGVLGLVSKGLRGTKLGDLGLNSSIRGVPLASEVVMDGTSGIAAGLVDAGIRPLLNGELPTSRALIESGAEYGLLSSFLRLGRVPFEQVPKLKGGNPPTGKETGGKTTPEKPVDPDSAEALESLPWRNPIEFDKAPKRQQKAVLRTGEVGEVIGYDARNGRSCIYRERPDRPDAPRHTVSEAELHSSKYFLVQYKGQEFAVDYAGNAYSVKKVDGAFELALSDKIILERLNEVQVPWPPITTNDRYKAPRVIRLHQMFEPWGPAM
jgi:hypothetical protein